MLMSLQTVQHLKHKHRSTVQHTLTNKNAGQHHRDLLLDIPVISLLLPKCHFCHLPH